MKTDTLLMMMKTVCSFETSGPAWRVKQRSLQEERIFVLNIFFVCILVRIVECAGRESLLAGHLMFW